MYYYGKGTKRNHSKALELFLIPAGNGYPEAQYYAGLIYLNGRGIRKDKAEGIKWLEKAARQGYKKAVRKLERMKVVLPHIP